MLAPNSAQIPPLLTGTKQNVFNPQQQQAQQQQAQAQQQQAAQQQAAQGQAQPSAAPAAGADAAAAPAVKPEGEAAAAGAAGAEGPVKMEVDAAPKQEGGLGCAPAFAAGLQPARAVRSVTSGGSGSAGGC
jgi:hypothetical protein